MTAIEAVVSDFGGVLTTPLMHTFAALQDEDGIEQGAMGAALRHIAERDGAHPLFELECGRMTEHDFLAALSAQLRADLGRDDVEMQSFAERYFAHLEPNAPMIAFLRELRDDGYRLAMLTNNVREWEARWRAMLPVDELFETVVDSAFVGLRKPDPAIYRIVCDRLALEPAQCLFLDDFPGNVDAARRLGMHGIVVGDEWRDAIHALRALLG